MDARLYATLDGGEISVVNGDLERDVGIETAVLLSLFGGNEEDSGIAADDRKQWWGNLTEPNPARRYRSETQNLLRAIPLIPINLRRIDDAVKRDLGWMVDSGVIRELATHVAQSGVDAVRIRIALDTQGAARSVEFLYSRQKGSAAS